MSTLVLNVSWELFNDNAECQHRLQFTSHQIQEVVDTVIREDIERLFLYLKTFEDIGD